MPDCVFCSIASGVSPAYHLYEDETTLSFLDIRPATRGHALAVPKEHHRTVLELDEMLVGDVFRTAQRVATALESVCDPDGINIVQSNGEVAGQEVFHVHVHVIPRFDADDVTLNWRPEDPDDAEMQETAAAIREALDSRS